MCYIIFNETIKVRLDGVRIVVHGNAPSVWG